MTRTLVLFEDNTELRKALVSLINNHPGYMVIGDYGDVNTAQDIIREKIPEIVILDINMPGTSGIDAISVIRENAPDCCIIMYTQFEDDEQIFRSLCAGADGYILKKTSPVRLVELIEEAVMGGAPMSPPVAKKVLFSFRNKIKKPELTYDLTSRESDILQLLVKGFSIKHIASELNIGYTTCRTHLKNIYSKLHVNCGKEAIAKILSEKIIS